MSYGFGYDSDEGRALCGAITAIMTGEAYEQSAAIGAGDGAIPRLSRRARQRRAESSRQKQRLIDARSDRPSPRRGARNSRQRRNSISQRGSRESLGQRGAARQAHGYRNAQVTVLAPTGTIGF